MNKKPKMQYWFLDLVLRRKLSEDKQNQLWNKIFQLTHGNLLTGGSQTLTKKQWNEIMKIINKKRKKK